LEREVAFSLEHLRRSRPFVLSFGNIADYILWRNPAVKVGEAEARRGARRWREIEKVFAREGWFNRKPPEGAHRLGGVYDPQSGGWAYLLLSDSPVRIPLRPRNMWLVAPTTTYSIQVGSAALYVKLLKLLVKAVIVRL